MKHYFVAALFVGALTLLIDNDARAQQTVRVGIPTVGAPFAFIDTDARTPQGMMVEILNAIGKDAGLRLQYQPMPVLAIRPSLLDNAIDMSGYPLQIPPSNRDQIHLSQPIMTYGEALAVSKSDEKQYTNYTDLKELRVGTVRNTLYVDLLQKAGANVQLYEGANVALADLNDGKLDGVVATGPVIGYATSNGTFPNTKAVSTFRTTISVPVAFAVRVTDAELLMKLNTSLAKLVLDGTVTAIRAKWRQ